MIEVKISDVGTSTSVTLDPSQSALVASEIDRIWPNFIERLLMRLFPGPDDDVAVAADYTVTVIDGGYSRDYEILSATVLRDARDGLEVNFFVGPQIADWHAAASGIARL